MTAPVAPAAAPAPAPVTPAAPEAPVTEVTRVHATTETRNEPAVGSKEELINRIGRKVSDAAKQFSEQAPAAPLETIATESLPQATQHFAGPVEFESDGGRIKLESRAQDGRYQQLDPDAKYDLSFKDPDGVGRQYESRSLKDIASMAVRSVKQQPEIEHYRKEMPRVAQQFEQMNQEILRHRNDSAQNTQRIAQLEALATQLLTAEPVIVDSIRQEYAQHNSPERENQRLKAQLAQMQNIPAPPPVQQPQNRVSAQETQLQQQFQAQMNPVWQEVESLVGRDAASKQFNWDLRGIYAQHGRIPSSEFQRVAQYMAGPLREWAKSEAAKNQASQTAQSEAQKELDAARAERARAQQAANAVGSATRPAGGMASTAAAPLPPARNKEELIQRISRRAAPA